MKGSMSTDTKNVNERMIDRIDAVLALDTRFDRYGPEDEAVLRYVRKQLEPTRLESRADDQFDSGSVTHLHEVAKMRLTPYEKEAEATNEL
jgi:hypothetical protein